jgi:hypothetical protein
MATFQQDLGCPPPPLDQLAQALLRVDDNNKEVGKGACKEPVGEEVLHWIGMVLVRQLLSDVATALATPWDDHTLNLVRKDKTEESSPLFCPLQYVVWSSHHISSKSPFLIAHQSSVSR